MDPLPTPLVAQAVTDALRARREEEGPRPTSDGTRGRGSFARSCARRIAFEITETPRDHDDTSFNLITWEIGQDAHNRLQAGLVSRFDARIEVPVSYRRATPQYDVSGNVDAVYDTHPLTGETRPNLVTVEIKSMAQYGFDLASGRKTKKGELPGPKVEHVTQAAIYGCAPQLESEFLHLIYYGKDKGTMAEWIFGMDEALDHLDGRTARELATEELERMQHIFETIDAGALPERVIPGVGLIDDPEAASAPWNCSYCSWQPTCTKMPATTVPLEEISVEERARRDLVDRVYALDADKKAALRGLWPVLVPRLVDPRGWTAEHLARVTGMVCVLEQSTIIPTGPTTDVRDGVATTDVRDGVATSPDSPGDGPTVTETLAGSTGAPVLPGSIPAVPTADIGTITVEDRWADARNGHVPPAEQIDPLLLETIAARARALPADLKVFGGWLTAVDGGYWPAPTAPTSQWPAVLATARCELYDWLEAIHGARRKRFFAELDTLSAAMDDDERHTFTAQATGVEGGSSISLTAEQLDRVVAHAAAQTAADGTFPTDQVLWKTRCAHLGVDSRAAMNHAKAIARAITGVDPPRKMADWSHPEIAPRLYLWMAMHDGANEAAA